MTVIGRPLPPHFNCQMAQLRASGVKVHAASPSLYQQWPVHICMSVCVCMQICNLPTHPPQFQTQAPLTPSTPPLLHSHFLSNTCSSSQKPLQSSSYFCPQCYVSCLHEIGCSVFLFCFFGSRVFFSQCHIGSSGENHSWQLFLFIFLNVFFFVLLFCFVFNVQLRYLYFCNIKVCYFPSSLS